MINKQINGLIRIGSEWPDPNLTWHTGQVSWKEWRMTSCWSKLTQQCHRSIERVTYFGRSTSLLSSSRTTSTLRFFLYPMTLHALFFTSYLYPLLVPPPFPHTQTNLSLCLSLPCTPFLPLTSVSTQQSSQDQKRNLLLYPFEAKTPWIHHILSCNHLLWCQLLLLRILKYTQKERQRDRERERDRTHIDIISTCQPP